MSDEINLHTGGGGKPFHEQIDEVRKLLEENLRYTKAIHEFTPKDAASREQEFAKLVHDNFEYTRACYALLEKIVRWIFWQRIMFFVKLILIIVPIVLGILFLPPLLNDAFQPYLELLDEAKKIQLNK